MMQAMKLSRSLRKFGEQIEDSVGNATHGRKHPAA